MRFLAILSLLAGSLSGCASVHVDTHPECRCYYLGTLQHHQARPRAISIQFTRSLP